MSEESKNSTNNSCEMAFYIFKNSDITSFTRESTISDVIEYYKELILYNCRETECDVNHIFRIIMSLLNLNHEYNSCMLEKSEEGIVHMDGYSIVGPGYNIIKKKDINNKIIELTQEDRFKLGRAAKIFNERIKYENKHNKIQKTELENEEIVVYDKWSRRSTRSSIVLNEPFNHFIKERSIKLDENLSNAATAIQNLINIKTKELLLVIPKQESIVLEITTPKLLSVYPAQTVDLILEIKSSEM